MSFDCLELDLKLEKVFARNLQLNSSSLPLICSRNPPLTLPHLLSVDPKIQSPNCSLVPQPSSSHSRNEN
jgi:hypothetical protein